MPQLSPDLFAAGESPLTVSGALALIASRVPAIDEREHRALVECDGRILAESLVASSDLPRFDNSAVDGYAVRAADLNPATQTTLVIADRIAAGHGAGVRLEQRTAARIFTGAPMPAGADTIFMQEDVRVEGAVITLPPGLGDGSNVRPRGEDIRAGDVALLAGRRLQPHDLALAAALGCVRLCVRKKLRVAIFSTGDEVVSPGDALPPAGLYDANRFALHALLRRHGCEVTDLAIVPDDRTAVVERISAAAHAHDLVVSSGGVSMGDEDHVRAALASMGSLVFWKLAIKPGRPVAMGVVDGTPVVGLPGNPVAMFVTYAFVVRPLIAALLGETRNAPLARPVISTFRHRKKPGRREFLRVTLDANADGVMLARLHPIDGTGIITSLTQTDGLIDVPEHVTRIEPGEELAFLSYDTLY